MNLDNEITSIVDEDPRRGLYNAKIIVIMIDLYLDMGNKLKTNKKRYKKDGVCDQM